MFRERFRPSMSFKEKKIHRLTEILFWAVNNLFLLNYSRSPHFSLNKFIFIYFILHWAYSFAHTLFPIFKLRIGPLFMLWWLLFSYYFSFRWFSSCNPLSCIWWYHALKILVFTVSSFNYWYYLSLFIYFVLMPRCSYLIGGRIWKDDLHLFLMCWYWISDTWDLC